MILPNLICLEDYGGSWDEYLSALHACFTKDFIDSTPSFQGKRLGLKKHPIIQGKEATFWHFISEGDIEAERTPNLRRCERLSWIRPIIEGHPHESIKLWIEFRGSEERIHLCYGEWEYLVVLVDRGDYIIPWTAFHIEHNHSKRKFERKYKAYQAKIAS